MNEGLTDVDVVNLLRRVVHVRRSGCCYASPMTSITRLREALATRADVELAVLFGSEARGTATPASDLDVAILGPASLDDLRLAADLTAACARDVSVTRLEDPPIPLLAAVVRDGVVLREGRRGAWASFRARAWTTLETDLPWWRRMAAAEVQRIATGERWSTKTSLGRSSPIWPTASIG